MEGTIISYAMVSHARVVRTLEYPWNKHKLCKAKCAIMHVFCGLTCIIDAVGSAKVSQLLLITPGIGIHAIIA